VKNKGVLAGKLKTVKRAFPQVPESEELEEGWFWRREDLVNKQPTLLAQISHVLSWRKRMFSQVSGVVLLLKGHEDH